MTYKICQTIFSTNRIPYLQKTLESQRLIDTTGCEITKIFFDDYPKDRNDRYLEIVVKHMVTIMLFYIQKIKVYLKLGKNSLTTLKHKIMIIFGTKRMMLKFYILFV